MAQLLPAFRRWTIYDFAFGCPGMVVRIARRNDPVGDRAAVNYDWCMFDGCPPPWRVFAVNGCPLRLRVETQP